jgi:hypothetical protein
MQSSAEREHKNWEDGNHSGVISQYAKMETSLSSSALTAMRIPGNCIRRHGPECKAEVKGPQRRELI